MVHHLDPGPPQRAVYLGRALGEPADRLQVRLIHRRVLLHAVQYVEGRGDRVEQHVGDRGERRTVGGVAAGFPALEHLADVGALAAEHPREPVLHLAQVGRVEAGVVHPRDAEAFRHAVLLVDALTAIPGARRPARAPSVTEGSSAGAVRTGQGTPSWWRHPGHGPSPPRRPTYADRGTPSGGSPFVLRPMPVPLRDVH